ncbi:hypothetical protein LCGC14_1613430 [marine sediment metagenome]|uniref:Uncharacterized protein n=1 Tax=marine sediment metagenome TaxID=412755 RepID=A0A0F9IUF2_9ZZZZ
MPRRLNDGAGYGRAMNALVPARTETYSPIPHSFFLDTVSVEINNSRGLEVTGQRIYTNMNGHKLVGFTSVKHKGMESDPDFGLEMMIGYKNSYDKSMSAALVAGVSVMICSNGLIGGDMVTFTRKHTGTIQAELREKVKEAITAMRDGFSKLVLEVDIMRDYQLTPKQKAELMGVMYFEENMVTPNQLSIIKNEMKESPYFKGDSLWDLYNNVTESFKTSHPLSHIEDHIKLHSFMIDVAGINSEEINEVINADGEMNIGDNPFESTNVDGDEGIRYVNPVHHIQHVGGVDPIDGRN